MESGKKRRANGWFWIVMLSVLVILWIMLSFIIHCLGIINTDPKNVIFIVFIVFFIPVLSREAYVLEKNIKSVFSRDTNKYAGLPKAFRVNREFHRYCLFRDELRKSHFKSGDVKKVRSLFDVEQYTLGSYVAQRPLTTWMAATLTVILGNSAKNWPLWFVGMVVGFCILIFALILYQAPLFISAYRRRFELHRWLAWYEADDSEPTALTVEHVNPPAG